MIFKEEGETVYKTARSSNDRLSALPLQSQPFLKFILCNFTSTGMLFGCMLTRLRDIGLERSSIETKPL